MIFNYFKILWMYVFSLSCKCLYNILDFAPQPTKPKIFTICFFTEKVC